MKYLDNEVEIRADGFRLFQGEHGSCGYFTIEESLVTDGQYPDKKISPGLQKSLPLGSTVIFRANY